MSPRVAVATMSLGCASAHSLDDKIVQAATHGLEGVEIFYEDLQQLANSFPGGQSRQNELAAARHIRSLCSRYCLSVVSLQPLWLEEGTLDPTIHQAKVKKTKHMLQLAAELGTDLVLIPSSITGSSAALSADMDKIAAHLRSIVDVGAASHPEIRFAYEALAFGTHIDTWQASWHIVKLVDSPNFGICLDTFNIAGRVFADPTSLSGETIDARNKLHQSLKELVRIIDVAKVFLVQVVDAQKLDTPLVDGHALHDPDQPARMSWSRNCRLFYGEKDAGAYLPILEVADAILNQLGYSGWVSMELFNASTTRTDSRVPAQHALRAMASWLSLIKDCELVSAARKSPDRMAKYKTSMGDSLKLRTVNPSINFRTGEKVEVPSQRPSAITYGAAEPFSPTEQRIWLFIGLSAFVGMIGSLQTLIRMLLA